MVGATIAVQALGRQLQGERRAREAAQQQLASAGQQVEELRGQHAQLVAQVVASQQEMEARAGALMQREEEVAELQAALQGAQVLLDFVLRLVAAEAQLAQAVAEEELAAVQAAMDAVGREVEHIREAAAFVAQ